MALPPKIIFSSLYPGIPAGPYTLQTGIWGFQEILQAFNNDTLPWLPGATAKDWKITIDDCHRAPFAGIWSVYMNLIFSVGCDSRIRHRTKDRKNPIFCAVLDAAVASNS
jgi:hypothetical protein